MPCWKCGKTLNTNQICENCESGSPQISDAKNSINSAIKRADKLGEGLSVFKEKIKKWRESSPNPIKQGLAENRVINRCIHYLCLMADDLEGVIDSKTSICQADSKELEEKALFIAELAKKLSLIQIKISTDTDSD